MDTCPKKYPATSATKIPTSACAPTTRHTDNMGLTRMVVHLILQSLPLYVKTHIAPKNHRRADNLTPMSAPTQESLIEYPCLFPIKVMGLQVDGFIHAVTYVAKQFDPTFDASTIELRESKGGKYLGVTITVTATSRDQLDALYQTLSTHPMVKVVL